MQIKDVSARFKVLALLQRLFFRDANEGLNGPFAGHTDLFVGGMGARRKVQPFAVNGEKQKLVISQILLMTESAVKGFLDGREVTWRRAGSVGAAKFAGAAASPTPGWYCPASGWAAR